MVAWWTGGAWVLYFADAPTLVKELATFQAPLVAYMWIGVLTFTTYALAGHMREQVCLYMCPWPRIQAALTDEHALNVTYRYDRGEPRGSVKKNAALRAQGQPAGDCVDCYQCVYVCPTGVDIRNGPNLGCIQCGLCIDACDAVMAKIGRPSRLIAYDTDLNIKRRQSGEPLAGPGSCACARSLYVGVIAVVGAVMLYTLATRQNEGISVIHDRNPLFVRLSDGELRNAFTVRILNKSLERRSFVLTVDGLPDLDLKVVGDTVTTGRMAVVVRRSRPDSRVARPGEHIFAAAACGFDPADVPHHRRGDRAAGERGRPFPRALTMRTTCKQSDRRRRTPPEGGDGTDGARLSRRLLRGVAGVNAVMIGAAVSTFGGVETESSYQAGLAFAREAAAVAAQDALHWQVEAKVSARCGRDGWSRSWRPMRGGRPLTGLQAIARLAHPTDRRADRTVQLGEIVPGRFRGIGRSGKRPVGAR